jgi:hypothetical protein
MREGGPDNSESTKLIERRCNRIRGIRSSIRDRSAYVEILILVVVRMRRRSNVQKELCIGFFVARGSVARGLWGGDD